MPGSGLCCTGINDIRGPTTLKFGFYLGCDHAELRLRRYVSVTINCEADSLSTNTNMLEAAQVPECFCNYLLGKNYKTKQNIICF